jgi:uncharacterized protein YciI
MILTEREQLDRANAEIERLRAALDRYSEQDVLLCAAPPAPADERVRVLERLVMDAAHTLDKARIWSGMGWTYNPLHPIHYRQMRDRLRNECDNISAAAEIGKAMTATPTADTGD